MRERERNGRRGGGTEEAGGVENEREGGRMRGKARDNERK
jgi:hypothetical protein